MTFKKSLALTVCGLCLVFAGQAMAEDGMAAGSVDKEGRRHMKILEKDTDGNGAISKVEFLNGAEERFAELDADNSGEITKDEFKAHHEKMRSKMKEWREKRQDRRGKMKGANDTPPPPPEE